MAHLFASTKAATLLWLLQRELGYRVVGPAGGSHRRLVAPGRPVLTFAFHDRDTVGPVVVRDVLVKQVGLDRDEAVTVMRSGR